MKQLEDTWELKAQQWQQKQQVLVDAAAKTSKVKLREQHNGKIQIQEAKYAALRKKMRDGRNSDMDAFDTEQERLPALMQEVMQQNENAAAARESCELCVDCGESVASCVMSDEAWCVAKMRDARGSLLR